MPKYYCDYCDTYLTHDSPSVRKTHCTGRKHRDNVKFYYQKWMEEQAQSLIDATTAAFKAGKIAQNPFAPPGAPGKGMAIPPPGKFFLFFFVLSQSRLIMFSRNAYDDATTTKYAWHPTTQYVYDGPTTTFRNHASASKIDNIIFNKGIIIW